MNKIEKLQAQLAAAQKDARTAVVFIPVGQLPVPDFAENALEVAEEYLKTLQDDVRIINTSLVGMYCTVNFEIEAAERNINDLNALYLAAADEDEAASLLAQINSAVNTYSMLAFKNPSENNAAYDALIRDRDIAVKAVSVQLNVVAALASVI